MGSVDAVGLEKYAGMTREQMMEKLSALSNDQLQKLLVEAEKQLAAMTPVTITDTVKPDDAVAAETK